MEKNITKSKPAVKKKKPPARLEVAVGGKSLSKATNQGQAQRKHYKGIYNGF